VPLVKYFNQNNQNNMPELQEKPIAMVTGGAGFIGSFLCEELLKSGYRVICVDDFSTGHVRNIDPYLRNPDFQFLRQDINVPFDLEAFPELEPFKVKFLGVQEIYHLAVPKSIKNYDKYRMSTLLVSGRGIANILDMAVKYKSKVLLASSPSVYGPRLSDSERFTEEYHGVVDHLASRSAYEEGRRFAETSLDTYKKVYGIETRIARIFKTYGPRMPLFDGFQISDFILNALNQENLIVHGDKDFKTTLIYVSDVVSGIVKLMAHPEDIGPVNFGNDVDEMIVGVADKIIAMTGSNSKVIFGEKLQYLMEQGLPDVHKAKEALHWSPVTRLEDGLQKTIDYIQANKILLTGE